MSVKPDKALKSRALIEDIIKNFTIVKAKYDEKFKK
jgi:hypothetical protein